MTTLDVRAVTDDQWELVAWLWQAFRNDLGAVVSSYPRADGRYKHTGLDGYPAPDRVGYLAWTLNPQLDADAESPVGFALVSGLAAERRHVDAFWVAPVVRRDGVGGRFALDVLGRHPGPWAIAFQHDNLPAAAFWRRVCSAAFGAAGEAWSEEQRPVPGKPDVAPDHWLETT